MGFREDLEENMCIAESNLDMEAVKYPIALRAWKGSCCIVHLFPFT